MFRNSGRDVFPGAKDARASAEPLIDSGLSFEIWLGPRPSVTAAQKSNRMINWIFLFIIGPPLVELLKDSGSPH